MLEKNSGGREWTAIHPPNAMLAAHVPRNQWTPSLFGCGSLCRSRSMQSHTHIRKEDAAV